MISAGIDIGSSYVKFVVLDGPAVLTREVAPATSRPRDTALALLKRVPPGTPVCATGYGRDLLDGEPGVTTITEIKAHALGARMLIPNCRAVIDIGGQDLKVIALDERGRVTGFEMNDRCAAGTGKFLEVMAHRLGLSMEEFAAEAERGADTLTISAMCTVFAESEVIGLVNQGHRRCDVARALHNSVVKRIVAMCGRLTLAPGSISATGGGSLNATLLRLLDTALGRDIRATPEAQIAGALGCAMWAGGTVGTSPYAQ